MPQSANSLFVPPAIEKRLMNLLQLKKQLRQERRMYETRAEYEPIHNRHLHQRILATWNRDYPQAVEQMKRAGILEDMAFVSQERMWDSADLYRKGGMTFSDARQQAEKDHLMLSDDWAIPDNES